MDPARHACTNPATGTSYRLVVTGSAWRITKSLHQGEQLRLAHLRGIVGDGALDHAAIGHLVAGTSGTTGACQPDGAFTAVILCDLERTAVVLIDVVRTTTTVHDRGCPGFRAKSPLLRAQRTRAMRTATEQMQCMAAMWVASGLVAAPADVPDWLRAAIEDLPRP